MRIRDLAIVFAIVTMAILLLRPAEPIQSLRAESITGYQCKPALQRGRRTLVDADLQSNRSFGVAVEGASILSIDTQFTHANSGALTWTCTGKSAPPDGDPATLADTTLTVCSVTAGTCTLSSAGVFTTASLTGDFDYNILVGVAGQDWVTCTLAHGGSPAAGDTVTVTGRLCTD